MTIEREYRSGVERNTPSTGAILPLDSSVVQRRLHHARGDEPGSDRGLGSVKMDTVVLLEARCDVV